MKNIPINYCSIKQDMDIIQSLNNQLKLKKFLK